MFPCRHKAETVKILCIFTTHSSRVDRKCPLLHKVCLNLGVCLLIIRVDLFCWLAAMCLSNRNEFSCEGKQMQHMPACEFWMYKEKQIASVLRRRAACSRLLGGCVWLLQAGWRLSPPWGPPSPCSMWEPWRVARIQAPRLYWQEDMKSKD